MYIATHKISCRRYLFPLLCLLLLCLFVSCGRAEDPAADSTDIPTQSESVTETEADTESGDTSETNSATESETSSDTESESESVPKVEPHGSPTEILFDGGMGLSFLKTTGCSLEWYEDAERGTVLKIQTSSRMNHVTLDYEGYMTAMGFSPIDMTAYKFATITFKTGAGYGETHTSSTLTFHGAAGDTSTCRVTDGVEATYSPKSTDWQTVTIGLSAGQWSGTLHNLLFTAAFGTRAEESYCIASISFANTLPMDMLKTPLQTEIPVKGLKNSFTVLQITDLHACDFTDEEVAAMTATRAADVRNRRTAFWGRSSYQPEDILITLGAYAQEIDAGLILATGDLIDFPSEANLALLERFITSSSTPVLFMAGNHDWCFSDDYMTPNAIATYLSRISALAGAVNGVSVYETEEIVFVTVDNSSDTISAETATAYFSAVTDARAKGKSVVLALHVPFTVETLVADCTRVWSRNICIGTGALSDWHEPTMSLFLAVTEGTELAPDAVISGHLHFSHEDVFPNGVPQLITGNASGDGLCRVIRFIPE